MVSWVTSRGGRVITFVMINEASDDFPFLKCLAIYFPRGSNKCYILKKKLNSNHPYRDTTFKGISNSLRKKKCHGDWQFTISCTQENQEKIFQKNKKKKDTKEEGLALQLVSVESWNLRSPDQTCSCKSEPSELRSHWSMWMMRTSRVQAKPTSEKPLLSQILVTWCKKLMP